MDPTTRRVLLSSSKKGDPVYVDDVFSTYLYEGDGTNNDSKAIPTGLDIANDGGLIWIKSREASGAGDDHILVSPGLTGYIRSNTTNGISGNSGDLAVPTATGFTVNTKNSGGTWYYTNAPSKDYASWSFRKAPGFFDVVTYTGNSTAGRTLSHQLGSVPGMIIIKATSKTSLWRCYHRSLPSANYVINLNQTAAATDSGAAFWNSTAPTASVFTLGDTGNVNETGSTYVAYIFAHDDAQFGTDGDESIIKCGSNSHTSGTFAEVTLGFEPQWVMLKVTTVGGWVMIDNMRGAPTGGNDAVLEANLSTAESSGDYVEFTPTGFRYKINMYGNNQTVLYMAIRRPNKPPEAATEVFNTVSLTNSSDLFSVGFPTDMLLTGRPDNANSARYFLTRFTPDSGLKPYSSDAEDTNIGQYIEWDRSNNFKLPSFWGTTASVSHHFKRAPGFFDVVAYTGTAANRTVDHNLQAVPELMIVKKRTATADWIVYSATKGATYRAYLNASSAFALTGNGTWNNTAPTSSVFTVGNNTLVNGGGANFIAYLFATLPGISKVGSYTGTGYDIDVDCGFTSGARFVLIKNASDSSNWMMFDTVRGIVSGNDPIVFLNLKAAQNTTNDLIDPLNSGFRVTSQASSGLNVNGDTFIFLAIA
jgi:hypothetical protein